MTGSHSSSHGPTVPVSILGLPVRTRGAKASTVARDYAWLRRVPHGASQSWAALRESFVAELVGRELERLESRHRLP